MNSKTHWGMNAVQRLKRSRRSKVFLTILSAWFLAILPAFSHPDLLEQISALTTQISKEQTNADLYLRRAELQRRHSEFNSALADVARAERLGATPAQTLSLRAQILFDDGKASHALLAANKSLEIEPHQPALLALRGNWLVQAGRLDEGIADFTKAIRYCTNPSPDLLLERAQAQAANGDLQGAVAGLDEGLRLLGPIPSVELAAIEYERRQKHFGEALQRLGRLIQRYPVKEPWLALRGEVFEQAGRYSEAETAFIEVLQGLEKYPPHRRSVAMTRQLEERAHAGLMRVRDRLRAQSISKTAAK